MPESSQAGCPLGGEQAVHLLAMMVSEFRAPSWVLAPSFLYPSFLSEQGEEGAGFLVHGMTRGSRSGKQLPPWTCN